MRGRFKTPTLTRTILAGTLPVLAILPVLAHAQSLDTWSLPEPEESATPRAQGPVDAQNPVLRPATPEAAPQASATPSPTPTITPLPVITPLPAPRTTASPSTIPRRDDAPQATPPSPTPVPVPVETPAPVPVTSEAPPTPPPASAAADTAWPAWWWAIPAALAAIGALALALLRFTRRRPQTLEWEEYPLMQPEAEAEPPAAPEREAAMPPSPLPLPTPNFTPAAPAPAPARDMLAIEFEPLAMRLSLFYATLRYRIALTASQDHAPARLLGDLISAHASLSRDEQLAPPPDGLAQLHALPGLAPGQTVELKGEILLSLPEIRALSQGGGAFFVPLVRICLIGEDGAALRRVYTVGLPGSGAGLAPLRIDTGPRGFEPLAAREIEPARQIPLQTGPLPLDPQRAAG